MTVRKRGRPWKRTCLIVLARDGWVCQIKGPRCTVDATTVDHVDPLALGFPEIPADLSRLRAACVACNSADGQRLSTFRGRFGAPSRRWTNGA